MAYLVEFIAIQSLGKCYIRNGLDVLASLQKPLKSLTVYKKQIPEFEEPQIKPHVSPIDPLFNLNFSFRANPELKS